MSRHKSKDRKRQAFETYKERYANRRRAELSQRINDHHVHLEHDKDGIYTLGLVGDTHLGTKLCNEEGILEYFDRAIDLGVTHFFHAGDVMDGLFVYPGQHNDSLAYGVDEQCEYAAEFFDRAIPKGIRMFFIVGNHELRAFEKFGADMGEKFESHLPSKVKYLKNKMGGNIYARVFIAPRTKLDLVHTRSYTGERGAPEYTLMKQLDAYGDIRDNYPDILGVNHTHAHTHSNYRGVHSYLNGAFEFPNQYIARLAEGRAQGSYVLKFQLDDRGKIREMTDTWLEVKRGL